MMITQTPTPTSEEIAELRTFAEAATPGPWQIGGVLREIINGDAEPTNLAVVYTHKRAMTITGECWDGDARYIALANPQTILALLDALAEQDVELKRLTRFTDLQHGWIAERDTEIARLYDALHKQAAQIELWLDLLAAEIKKNYALDAENARQTAELQDYHNRGY